MLHSEIGLFGRSSDSWDTDCARKFLQIPEEQLKKLESIPGWSTKKEINKKQVEELSASQLKNHEKTINQFGTIHNINISDALTQKSALPPRKKSKISSPTDQQLFHSISLGNNNEAVVHVQKTNSASDIHMLEEEDKSPLRRSGLEDISSNMNTEQSTSTQANKQSVGKSLLDTTYVVSSVLEDKTNDIQIVSDAQSQKPSSPVKMSTKKRTFEDPETDVTNQPFEKHVSTFGGLPVFQNTTVATQVSHENILSKKLRLLEKRFSPLKDFRVIESHKDLIKEVDEDLNSVVEINSQKSAKASLENDKAEDIQRSKEKEVEVKLSEKEYVEVASTKSKVNVFEEESFVSQPIPCGQPPPKDQPHSSTQLPIESQPSVKKSMAENANKPALPEKCIKQVELQEFVPGEGNKVGRKRKLKSKGENTSKKPSGKKPIVMQYSAEQIRNIIKIMKIFQSEM